MEADHLKLLQEKNIEKFPKILEKFNREVSWLTVFCGFVCLEVFIFLVCLRKGWVSRINVLLKKFYHNYMNNFCSNWIIKTTNQC